MYSRFRCIEVLITDNLIKLVKKNLCLGGHLENLYTEIFIKISSANRIHSLSNFI